MACKLSSSCAVWGTVITYGSLLGWVGCVKLVYAHGSMSPWAGNCNLVLLTSNRAAVCLRLCFLLHCSLLALCQGNPCSEIVGLPTFCMVAEAHFGMVAACYKE